MHTKKGKMTNFKGLNHLIALAMNYKIKKTTKRRSKCFCNGKKWCSKNKCRDNYWCSNQTFLMMMKTFQRKRQLSSRLSKEAQSLSAPLKNRMTNSLSLTMFGHLQWVPTKQSRRGGKLKCQQMSTKPCYNQTSRYGRHTATNRRFFVFLKTASWLKIRNPTRALTHLVSAIRRRERKKCNNR
jgi:hypothetical protein